ncbi:MAG TPA: hypothetical protein VHH57_11480 [Gaiella sp.]|jgi:hypothetical protein|nr:hypothetical protein [Gaiella sp.]
MPIRLPLNGLPAARSLGLVAGVLLAVAALLAWRVPAAPTGPGAAVTITATPTGELAVSQHDAFLSAPALIPSSPAGGASAQVVVTNQSPIVLAVVMRALPSTDVLDETLHVEVAAGEAVVYSGSLEGLRTWTRRVLVFTPGASQALTVEAWIPTDTPTDPRGQEVDVSLELKTRPA